MECAGVNQGAKSCKSCWLGGARWVRWVGCSTGGRRGSSGGFERVIECEFPEVAGGAFVWPRLCFVVAAVEGLCPV